MINKIITWAKKHSWLVSIVVGIFAALRLLRYTYYFAWNFREFGTWSWLITRWQLISLITVVAGITTTLIVHLILKKF